MDGRSDRQSPGDVLAEVWQLPGGDAGTRATLAHLAAVARGASWHPELRDAARAIFRDDLGRRGLGPAAPLALREWIARVQVYLPDPLAAEYISNPVALLAQLEEGGGRIAGDCDDVAGLVAALALAAGLRARFLAVQFDGQAGFRHVWAAVAFPGGPWVDCDPTRPTDLPAVSRVWAMGA